MESADACALHEDHTGSDEPDARDDLGGHPRRVEGDGPGCDHVLEAELADQDEDGRSRMEPSLR
jgi:hypothetical protein